MENIADTFSILHISFGTSFFSMCLWFPSKRNCDPLFEGFLQIHKHKGASSRFLHSTGQNKSKGTRSLKGSRLYFLIGGAAKSYPMGVHTEGLGRLGPFLKVCDQVQSLAPIIPEHLTVKYAQPYLRIPESHFQS